MKLRTFIERPVLSAVISIVIVFMGIIGLTSLPVEQYPDIAPPTVMVSTTYFGASAETLQKSVIAPLEEAINGVEDMTYMTSTATNAGTVSIMVYFKQGTDPDMATVNVQNRVSKATGQLPAEVTQVGVTTTKRQTSMLQIFSIYSPDDSYDEGFLANYLSINLKPEILRISGVGELMVMGGDYSMRVWWKPDVMAQYNLIPSDVTAVLAEQNIESATGAFGENSTETYQYTMKYKGRLIQPEEFGDIVIRSTEDGEVLKLKDIAEIELGRENYSYIGELTGHVGVSCMVFQTARFQRDRGKPANRRFPRRSTQRPPKGVEIVQMMELERLPVRFHPRGDKDIDRSDLTGYPGGIHFPAGYPFDPDPAGRYHRVADRYIRIHVDCRIQYQPDYFVCTRSRDRYGGRRCHRRRRGGTGPVRRRV